VKTKKSTRPDGSSGSRYQGPGVRHAVTPNRWLAPAELFLSSFIALIILGSLGLKFLPGIYQGEPLNWTDAIFTSTSAVCVTGLIVVDTAT